ncbi:MAG: succinate dehydrogenase/fumarate reductase iron-sulfur subunit [Planctomycetota bacterium]|jgi:succinate dehydrogenase / fumarate reductase, iron-sulfur subunit|nr:succinate dehydrogenase/fumarate reductase iron-sulfur subunit [Planctomycetota bacterium]
MKFRLNVWRQGSEQEKGSMQSCELDEVSSDMSFLEMLDYLNETLISKGEEPIAFDSDCREGVCGMCSLVINGQAHGPMKATTTCQTYMRLFPDGSEITIEPWRAGAFPVLRDLIVNRSSFDRIMQAGGYITVHSGPKPEPNSVPINQQVAEESLDAAVCIGCGACVAACPNGSAMLYTAAKVSHFALLPQGQAERTDRALAMVDQMQTEGFGSCRNYAECEAACPKAISINFIGQLNREYIRATAKPCNARGQMHAQ